MISDDKIALFRSLFQGREDVFALYWEKSGKSGYMPAVHFDPYRFKVHQMKGGTMSDFPEKAYQYLTNEQIKQHILGNQLIGIYPLLTNNSSWFIVADFDEENWSDDSRKFLSLCGEKKITAYLERSRSGNGAHVWIFFEQPYPAIKSRKVLLSLLTEASIISTFDKNSSFDRLFPNQDKLAGKGFGNLIALPFYKPAMDRGNSCFIDPQTMEPHPDQWQFLTTIQRVQISIPLENLEFKYDAIGFSYIYKEPNKKLEFEIAHEEVRPEFEVLKPYFVKALKTKNIRISIYAELEKGVLVSQTAESEDIKRINKEIIEGVRFKFMTKAILNKSSLPEQNILDINQLQAGQTIYETSEELITDLLKHPRFKHHQQLRYLAERHAGHILKIRFVLQPFSFVFLIEGEEMYHVILETLDTEEASYLWFFEKQRPLLPSYLKELDKQLDIIRQQGRQIFLTDPPANFSRIVHDYNKEQKGFITWKYMLEERLI